LLGKERSHRYHLEGTTIRKETGTLSNCLASALPLAFRPVFEVPTDPLEW
jgi:hypothetical protein